MTLALALAFALNAAPQPAPSAAFEAHMDAKLKAAFTRIALSQPVSVALPPEPKAAPREGRAPRPVGR